MSKKLDKITLGTLIGTSVIGFGGGAFAGFCDAHNLRPAALTMDIKNCALILSPVLGVPTGCIMGVADMKEQIDKGRRQSHGDIFDGVEEIVSGFSGGIFYGAVSAVSIGVGYGLGYLTGYLTK